MQKNINVKIDMYYEKESRICMLSDFAVRSVA